VKKLLILLLLILITTTGYFAIVSDSQTNNFDAKRVAHAGGAIELQTYTNSYEALNINYENNFRYFEIDFSLTSDGRIVCIHDWDATFTYLFGFTLITPPTFQEFKRYSKSISKFESCTLEGLAEWMHAHPGAVIITDIKSISHLGWTDLDVLKKIYNELPGPRTRVIPQFHYPKNYNSIKKIGFDSVIWTLYLYEGTDDEIIFWAQQFEGKIAVAMPQIKAKHKLPARLRKIGIPAYVYTINSRRSALNLLYRKKVSNLYTDYLPPDNLMLNIVLNEWKRFTTPATKPQLDNSK